MSHLAHSMNIHLYWIISLFEPVSVILDVHKTQRTRIGIGWTQTPNELSKRECE